MKLQYKVSVEINALETEKKESLLNELAGIVDLSTNYLRKNIFDYVLSFICELDQPQVQKVEALLFNAHLRPQINPLNKIHNKITDIDEETIDALLVEVFDKETGKTVLTKKEGKTHNFANSTHLRMQNKQLEEDIKQSAIAFDTKFTDVATDKPIKNNHTEPQMLVSGIDFKPVEINPHKNKQKMTINDYHHESDLQVDDEFASKLMPQSNHQMLADKDDSYTLVFKGEFTGVGLEEAILQFAQIFQKTPQEAQNFFLGNNHIIQKNLSHEKALQLQEVIQKYGLILHIVKT